MATPDHADDLVVDLLQAATRTEGKGQLNIAKMLRASAHALLRTAAAEKGFPDDLHDLVADLRALSERIERAGIPHSISNRIALGASLLASGEQSYGDKFRDPHVCRRCGLIVADEPPSSCPRCAAHALTFERFEPVYWTAEYTPPEVVGRLAETPALFASALTRIPADRHDWRPGNTAWSAADVIRHVRDAETVLAQRIRLIMDEAVPRLAFQPVFEWTNRGTGQTRSATSIMETYVASRSSTVARLRAISHEAWLRTGIHEEFGRVSLIEQASYFAAHELTHLRQLELLRRELPTPP